MVTEDLCWVTDRRADLGLHVLQPATATKTLTWSLGRPWSVVARSSKDRQFLNSNDVEAIALTQDASRRVRASSRASIDQPSSFVMVAIFVW